MSELEILRSEIEALEKEIEALKLENQSIKNDNEKMGLITRNLYDSSKSAYGFFIFRFIPLRVELITIQ